MIKDKLPDQLKLPFGLWTRQAVQQLIEDKFGVKLSRLQVGRYLKSHTVPKSVSKNFKRGYPQVNFDSSNNNKNY